jgi:hypothetical protein
MSMLLQTFQTEQGFLDYMKQNLPNAALKGFTDAYKQQGVTDIQVDWAKVLSLSLDANQKASGLAVAVLTLQVEFETNRVDLQASPIAPLVIIAIGIAIAFIIAALTLPLWLPVIGDWLKSMTTTTTTSTKYAWTLNPQTGQYEWKPASTETTTTPDLGGIGSIGLILIAVVAVVLIFTIGLPKMRK